MRLRRGPNPGGALIATQGDAMTQSRCHPRADYFYINCFNTASLQCSNITFSLTKHAVSVDRIHAHYKLYISNKFCP